MNGQGSVEEYLNGFLKHLIPKDMTGHSLCSNRVFIVREILDFFSNKGCRNTIILNGIGRNLNRCESCFGETIESSPISFICKDCYGKNLKLNNEKKWLSHLINSFIYAIVCFLYCLAIEYLDDKMWEIPVYVLAAASFIELVFVLINLYKDKKYLRNKTTAASLAACCGNNKDTDDLLDL